MNWPIVTEDDDGIRPNGRPDACFYCDQQVGKPHSEQCVIVNKVVRVRYSFTIDVEVPHHWSDRDVEFHRNDGTWCADNAIGELEAAAEIACLCPNFKCEVIGVVDPTPRKSS
jgi:hypothetical protein